MNLHLLETQKPQTKAFLKTKSIRKLLESFKLNRTQFSNSNNEKETERFSKNLFQYFLKKLFIPRTILSTKAVACVSLLLIINYSLFAASKTATSSLIKRFPNTSSVLNNSAPPISATITGPSDVCINATNQVITFTGNDGVGPYTFIYTVNGSPQSATTTINPNTVTIVIPTNSLGTFTYVLTSVNGESVINQSLIVNVHELPVVDFTFLNNQCSGSSVTFNSVVTGVGPYTYSWDFGDGGTSTLEDPSHVFNASLGCGTQSFTVVLTVTNSFGCVNTFSNNITVKQKPDISFSDLNYPFDQFSNCSQIFLNSSYSILVGNSSASSSCISSYSINWGDGNSQSNITFPISHIYTSTGVYTMSITGIGINGCISNINYIVKNVSNPLGGLNSPGTTQNLCAPTNNLQFSISNWALNSLDTTYNINYGDNTPVLILTQSQLVISSYYNTNNPSNSLNYPIPHIYSISSCPATSFVLTMNVTNACGTTPFTLGNISILKRPIANFTAPIIACINNNILFTNNTTSGYGQSCSQVSNYSWNFGDGTPIVVVSNSTPQNINHTFITSGNFTVTLTAQNYCGTTSLPQTICIESPLVPLFTLNTTSGCSPLSVTTTNSTILTNSCPGNPSYLWNVTYASGYCGSTTPTWSYTSGSETTSNPSFSFVTPGTYSIKVTMTNSCGAVTSAIQTVIVKKPPTVAINTLATICQTAGNATITPTAVVNGCAPTTSALTYTWNFPGGSPTTSTSATPGSITYSSSGTYTVSLSVTNECGTTIATDKIFTINPLPTISGTLSACVGQTATLSGSPSPATTSPWASSTPAIATISSSGVVTGISAGTTTITYTNSFGCQTTALFTVNTVPTASITGNASVCLNSNPSTITFTGANGIAPYIFTYSINNGLPQTISTISGNSIVLPAITSSIGVFNYCLLSVKDSSLSQCIKTYSNTCVTITVSALPTIVTQPLTSQTICVGGTIAPLTVSYIDGLGTATYKWYTNTTATNTGGTIIAGATSTSYTPPSFSTAGTYYYYAVVTLSGTGCGVATSLPATVIVVADPIVSVQPLATQTQCQSNAATQLSVSATGGTGTFTYQWYSTTLNNTTSGTIIATATSDTYTPSTATVGTVYYYCIIGQTGLGCNATSATAAVIVVPAPTINLQPQPSSVCQNGTPTTLSVTYIMHLHQTTML